MSGDKELVYDDYINNIIMQRGRFGLNESLYKERHHIIPKCLGGLDSEDNLIDLLPEEHYIAHKLLAIENVNNSKLVFAFWMMSNRNTITEEDYKLAKQSFTSAISQEMTGRKFYNNGEIQVFVRECPEGYVEGLLPFTKIKAKLAKQNLHWYNNGEVQTLAKECPSGYTHGQLKECCKLRAAKREYNWTDISKQKISKSITKLWEDDNYRQKVSDAHKGKKITEEQKINYSIAQVGRIVIHKDEKEKRIYPYELEDYKKCGWEKGCSLSHRRNNGRKHRKNNTITK